MVTSFADAVIRIVGVRLPMLIDGEAVWPRWPLTLRTRLGPIPPFPFVPAHRAMHRCCHYYAWGPLAVLLIVLDWYDHHRWDLEVWCIDHGIMVGPDGGYYWEFHFTSPRRWFRRYPRSTLTILA